MQAVAWIAAHWDQVLGALAGLVAVASVVVRLTPTVRDDQALAKVVRVLEVVSLARRRPAVVSAAAPAAIDQLVDELSRGDTAALEELLQASRDAAAPPR